MVTALAEETGHVDGSPSKGCRSSDCQRRQDFRFSWAEFKSALQSRHSLGMATVWRYHWTGTKDPAIVDRRNTGLI